MKEIKGLEDLFYHELQVLWSAENLLIEAMPKMIDKANNEGLKNMLRLHFAETDQHKIALELICKQLGIDAQGDFNPGIRGVIEQGDVVMFKEATNEGMDAALIAGAQKIEHYEISAYGSEAYFAEMLGYKGVSKRLWLTLAEEHQAVTKLNFLAKNIINPRAQLVEEELFVK